MAPPGVVAVEFEGQLMLGLALLGKGRPDRKGGVSPNRRLHGLVGVFSHLDHSEISDELSGLFLFGGGFFVGRLRLGLDLVVTKYDRVVLEDRLGLTFPFGHRFKVGSGMSHLHGRFLSGRFFGAWNLFNRCRKATRNGVDCAFGFGSGTSEHAILLY